MGAQSFALNYSTVGITWRVIVHNHDVPGRLIVGNGGVVVRGMAASASSPREVFSMIEVALKGENLSFQLSHSLHLMKPDHS